MQRTHDLLVNSLKRKECSQIKFEDFNTNFNETFISWLKYWEISPNAYPKLLDGASLHDLNRLTPEQKAAHNHVSGFSLTKDDAQQVAAAFSKNSDLSESLARQRRELNY
jgi:hypothetical protein